nr:MAG TPA: hypothetical protein [Caudoviricetes sp.]
MAVALFFFCSYSSCITFPAIIPNSKYSSFIFSITIKNNF